MQTKKLSAFLSIILVLALSLASIPFSSATIFLASGGTHPNDWTTYEHCADVTPNAISMFANTFYISGSGYLSQIDVLLCRYGNPAGVYYTMQVNGTSSQSYTSTPNSTLFENSLTNINAMDVPLVQNDGYDFTVTHFLFSNHVNLTAGYYSFIIRCFAESTNDASNHLRIGMKSSGTDKLCFWVGSAWTAPSGNTISNNVFLSSYYGGSEPTPTPGPTASPSPAPDNVSTIITALVTPNNVLLIIAFAIIIIGAILGAKFAGGWGFLAGLTVGTGLDSIFGLISIWFVVLIGIVDAIALVRGINAARQDNGAN